MDWLLAPARPQPAGVTYCLRLRPDAVLRPEEGGATVAHPWGLTRVTGVEAAGTAALHRLAAGWTTPDELLAAGTGEPVIGDTADPLAAALRLGSVLWTCGQLAFLLELRVLLADRPFLTVRPVSAAAALPAPVVTRRPPRLSRLAYLGRQDDEVVLASAVSAHRIVLHGDRPVSLVAALARGQQPPPGDEATAVVPLLAGAGMLEGTEAHDSGGIGSRLLDLAEFPDLLLHQHSRLGRQDGGFGAEFPFRGRVEPEPAVPPALAGQAVALPEPGTPTGGDLTLTQALERRVSIRRYGERPLTAAQLGEFLFRAARLRGRYGPLPDGMPYEACDKPYPSGGGVHDLELYPIVTAVDGLVPGAYHYAADRHALEPLPAAPAELAALLAAAVRASAAPAPPPVLVTITSRFGRMAWKYRGMAYATTLKNVGALYQTMYLVATAMGLAGCALGSGDDVAGSRALGLEARAELGVGEFMLGPAWSPAAAEAETAHRRAQDTWRPFVRPGWPDQPA